MPRVRIHQHVNPLSPFYRFAPPPIQLESIFAKPQPLHLDIGCGRGRFVLKMAELFPEINFLGVEIRYPLVEEANRLAQANNLTNLRYEFTNATYALGELLKDLPAAAIQTATIQFPDPWYKRKHAKRRMVDANLIETIVRHTRTAGEIFIQTDVDFLAAEMFETLRANENLREIIATENPFPVKTEREAAVEEKNLPVYRAMFTKK